MEDLLIITHYDIPNWEKFIEYFKDVKSKNLMIFFPFENVEILDRADTVRKLEYKEMLSIRKHKPTINKQTEGELFTLIIRNVKLET